MAFLSLLLFILKPQNYILPITYLGWALFMFFISPEFFKYAFYASSKKKLNPSIIMKFSQHEYVMYSSTQELRVSYDTIQKLVETDQFLFLYVPTSSKKMLKKQVARFIPKYIFDNQQLELLKEWIKHDIIV